MSIITFIAFFIISCLTLAVAIKLTEVELTWKEIIIINGSCTLIGLIPWGGGLLSLIAYCILLKRFGDASFKEIFIIVIIEIALLVGIPLLIIMAFGEEIPAFI